MRVVFLYTSYGAAGVGTSPPWDSNAESTNHFLSVHGLPTEGYFHMLLKLKEAGAIDDLIIFIESNRSPGKKVISGITCYVVPRIEYVENFLQEGDVIFVRGGFRGWYNPFLLKMKEQKRWLILYAANTGRQRWITWDVVLSDLNTCHSFDRRGRFWFFFRKPINPEIFYRKKMRRDIDVCIGASKIHDKKAQFKIIDALVEHKRIFNRTLKCIMPGHMRCRGVGTPQIMSNINNHDLNVEQPGFVDRYELNNIFNRSKLFVYLGNSGENDRGPLEATSVGCMTLLGGTTRHAPFLRKGGELGLEVSENPNNPVIVAKEMNRMLNNHHERVRDSVMCLFEKQNGFDCMVIPEMTRLFNCIRNNPQPNLDALKEEFL